ncbi:ABC-F family ATP-binding cassette domain-containing protein [Ferrimonas sp. YFM]|uniref:ABC-F family ATP-binding cassette domain-containing protein n=1 Tax=Ferrimonas sp. YFM TaxID=3028878 RepID=UPI0025739E3C|nr:ABC-F family ATP-binding cassette domain-containing protein [Ferrimonas sp. YFM]BDY04601.1 ABC transporter [Ferrimonas sp. YFM]
MTTLLTTHSLTLRPDNHSLLDAANITLKQGDRIGLIGFNGCGKSSLLSVLATHNQPAAGIVTQANGCVIAYVEQRLPCRFNEMPLTEVLLDQLPQSQREEHLWLAESHLASVGFNASQYQQYVSSLSGGEHTRLMLARALMQEPDLMLLDEPSNHLDLPTTLWLEQFLQNWKGSFVLVSHDRRLLDSVTNCSWIMQDRQLHQFQLPCTEALSEFKQQAVAAEKTRLSQEREIARIEASATQKAQWGKVYDNEDFARKAKHMFRRAERIKQELTDKPQTAPWSIELQTQPLAADRLIELTEFNVVIPTTETLLYQVDNLRVKSGDRIAIVGANGCGKTTLLQQLWRQHQLGIDSPALTIHPRCVIGFYDQEQRQLDDDDTLLTAIGRNVDLPSEPLKMALIRAGFDYGSHSKTVARLSGGERARLLLAGLNLGHHPLLLLDEPTNHLDLDGKAQLATVLSHNQGAIVMVSHDRDFIESCCNRFWLIDGQELIEINDPEQAYQRLQSVSQRESSASTPSPADSSEPKPALDDEALLQRLCQLEQLLADDLARKAKHQKPSKQQQWQSQIRQLTEQLGLG